MGASREQVGAARTGPRQQVGQLQGCADIAPSVLEPNRLYPRPGDIAEQRVAIHVDRFGERLKQDVTRSPTRARQRSVEDTDVRHQLELRAELIHPSVEADGGFAA